jgi:hypothetical protein
VHSRTVDQSRECTLPKSAGGMGRAISRMTTCQKR